MTRSVTGTGIIEDDGQSRDAGRISFPAERAEALRGGALRLAIGRTQQERHQVLTRFTLIRESSSCGVQPVDPRSLCWCETTSACSVRADFARVPPVKLLSLA
jgi:hypothetical protein